MGRNRPALFRGRHLEGRSSCCVRWSLATESDRPPVPVPLCPFLQDRGAGPSSNQTAGPSELRLSSLSLGVANASWNRNDEHDPQGPAEVLSEKRYHRTCRVRWTSVRLHHAVIAGQRPRPLCSLFRFAAQPLDGIPTLPLSKIRAVRCDAAPLAFEPRVEIRESLAKSRRLAIVGERAGPATAHHCSIAMQDNSKLV